MRKKLIWWQVAGFLFTGALGTFLHFLYEWTGESVFAALVSGVNESTWEHMKLLFVPMLLFSLIEAMFIGKDWDDFWCTKLFGIVVGLVAIPVLYYTYTGVLGKNLDWFNITIFFISAALSYFVETRRFLKHKDCYVSEKLSVIILIIIALLFVLFTFFPPETGLFCDPLTKLYGI